MANGTQTADNTDTSTAITGYGTTATDPYKSSLGTDITTPPPITPPPPLSSNQPVQTPSTLLPHTKGSTFATAASLLTGVMRGAMAGYDRAQQIKAQKLNALMQGLQRNAETSAQKAIDIAKSGNAVAGVDPKTGQPIYTKEYQDAANAADAADAMMWRAYGNAMGLNKPDKGKGAKKDQQQDQTNPVSVLTDKTAKPQDKLKALVQAHSAVGPAWRHQVAPYLTPDYRKQLELSRGEQRIEGDVEAKRIELHDLQNTDPAKLNDNQKRRLEQLQSDPELFPQLTRTTPHYATFTTPGSALAGVRADALGNPIDPKGYYRKETVGGQEGWVPAAPPPSLTPKPRKAWMRDDKGKVYSVAVDPNTNQPIKGTEDYNEQPPAGMMDQIRTGEFTVVDKDGNVWRVPTTTTIHHVANAGGSGGAGAAKPAAAAKPSTTPASTSSGEPAPPVPGAKLVAHKQAQKNPEETTADINAQNAIKDTLPIIDGLIKELEPHKNEGGWSDAAKSHLKWWAYKGGVAGDPESDKLKQLIGFVSIAGAAPWSKIGRGKYIFEQAQAHLPQPTDSPGLAYNKLKELKQIYEEQLGSANVRLGKTSAAAASPAPAAATGGTTSHPEVDKMLDQVFGQPKTPPQTSPQ